MRCPTCGRSIFSCQVIPYFPFLTPHIGCQNGTTIFQKVIPFDKMHSTFCNINLRDVAPSLISQNPREQMFLV